ncbi:MAG: DsbA family protein [Patescibacteria group bacterium]|nr:DsbA family protein [Patescibacteria group bacterium]
MKIKSIIKKAQIKQENIFLIILGLIILFFVIYIFSDFKITRKNLDERIKVTNINVNEILGNLPPLGNPNAPIKIVEFGDFHCPFCAQVPEVIFNSFQNYIDNGMIVIYFRDFPLPTHPFSYNTHLASRCANEQNKYWDFHKKVFQDFLNGLGQKTGEKDYLFNLAKSFNLDENKFKECYENKKYDRDIKNDYLQGTQLGVRGTPAFFVNNLFISGLDVQSINKAIDIEIEKLNK